jgi:hypothetical protein
MTFVTTGVVVLLLEQPVAATTESKTAEDKQECKSVRRASKRAAGRSFMDFLSHNRA